MCGPLLFQRRAPAAYNPKDKVKRILRMVAKDYHLDSEALIGISRFHTVSLARHEAMYLVRLCTALSYPEIARHFGGRDHTTIISAYRRIQRLANLDSHYSRKLGQQLIALQQEERS